MEGNHWNMKLFRILKVKNQLNRLLPRRKRTKTEEEKVTSNHRFVNRNALGLTAIFDLHNANSG